MDSLQRQMEEHTITVHQSVSSLTNTELELQNSVTKSSIPLKNAGLEDEEEEEQEQCS